MTNGSDVIKRSTDLLTGLFVILTGVMVFLPSMLGAIKPPHVFDGVLLTFWITGCISFVCLGISIYLVRFTSQANAPYKLMGLGFWAALVAFLSLAVYVGANVWQDRIALPEIVSIDISPLDPEPGNTMKFSAVAIDQDGDQLNYRWEIDGRIAGSGQTIYWVTPPAEGSYELTLAVDDGRPDRATQNRAQFDVKTKRTDAKNRDKLVNTAIKNALAEIQKRDPTKYTLLKPELLSDYARQRCDEEFHQNEQLHEQHLLEGALVRAVETLPNRKMLESPGFRWPCCSKYLVTYPFCDVSC